MRREHPDVRQSQRRTHARTTLGAHADRISGPGGAVCAGSAGVARTRTGERARNSAVDLAVGLNDARSA